MSLLFRFVNKPSSALVYRNIPTNVLAHRNIPTSALVYRNIPISTPCRNISTKNSIYNKLKNAPKEIKETQWYKNIKIKREKKKENNKNTIFGHITNAVGVGFIAEEILGLIFVAIFGVYLLWENHPILAILAGITLFLLLTIIV